MIRVPVRLRRMVDESHDIRIGRSLGARLSVDLRRRAFAARYVVVADGYEEHPNYKTALEYNIKILRKNILMDYLNIQRD